MRVILGIGNPGKEYEATRHNIGFMVVDELARRAGLRFERHKKWDCDLGDWRLPPPPGGDRVLLLKPKTYVNRSGQTAQAALTFHQLKPSELMVVVDDLNLPLGTLRLRGEGSSGGHNGLRDIEARLGKAYPRLRIGIGAPRSDHVVHVLGRFDPEEREDVVLAISRAADCCERWLTEGLEAAMTFNGPLHPPEPKPKPPRPAPAPKADEEEAGGQADG